MSEVGNKKEKITFKWTLWEILKGKTFPVIVATFVTQITLTTVIDMLGLYIIPVVFYLPSFVMGVLAVWIYQNNKNINKMVVVNVPIEELERREKKFKWHGLYGVLLGYMLWGLSIMLIAMYASELGIWLLVLLIAVPVIIIITYKPINKKLVEKTGTNVELIKEYKAGWYNHLLPEDCSSDADRTGILVCMEKAEAHTFRGAMYMHRAKRWLKGIGKVGGVLGAVASVLILILTVGVVNNFNKSVDRNMRDFF